METRIPLMIIPDSISNKFATKFRGVGANILNFFKHIETDLKMTDIDVRPDEYVAKSLLNSLVIGGIFGMLIIFLFLSQEESIAKSIALGIAIGIGICMMFLIIFIRYPDILASKKAENINKDLVFALKDISLQISAGVSLYDAFISVAVSNYEDTSNEFKKIVQKVNSGTPMIHAIEEMALNTKSEFLKRTSWQMVNALKAGSNIKKVLRRIIKDLTSEQKTRIRNYARELNLWSLVYMLFAVAVPSIGSTMLVILSSFAGFGVTKPMFIVFIILCFIAQYVLIGFVKVRRPVSNI